MRFLVLSVALSCLQPPDAFADRVGGSDPSLRDAIVNHRMEPSRFTKAQGKGLCDDLLVLLRSGSVRELAPAATANSFASVELESYRESCPDFAWKEAQLVPYGRVYVATRNFRFYDLPADSESLSSENHVIFYAGSYFNSEAKEQFKDYPDIYKFAGFAWPDGSGGGGLYTVVDTHSCERQAQLVVHGTYNHMTQRPTPHFSAPFLYLGEVYFYDFHNYADETVSLSGFTIWHLLDAQTPKQVCVYHSAETRRVYDSLNIE